jgi:Domain of unknown function (DUF5060)
MVAGMAAGNDGGDDAGKRPLSRRARLSRRRFLAGAAGATGLGVLEGCGGPAGPGGPGNPRRPDPVGTLSAPSSVSVFGKFEMTGEHLPPAANPFDPTQIDVRAHLRDPSGHERQVPAFWYQGYVRSAGGADALVPEGAPVWKARFTPDAVGRWSWWWTRRSSGDDTVGNTYRLDVTASPEPAHGFVRRSERDHRYLVHDDGTPYFAIGENVAWPLHAGGAAVDDYQGWFGRLGSVGGANFARVWMPSWGFGLEWQDTGLGDYTRRLDRAWELDQVFDLAQQNGLALMLSLQNHGAFSTTVNSQWARNPYNRVNGGPLDHPSQFFTDPQARDLFRRRLRYTVARWAYSPALMAWELWNEVTWVDHYDSQTVAGWHRDFTAYLRSVDPHGHLVTTSFGAGPDPVVTRRASLDFAQRHLYLSHGGEVPGANVAATMQRFTAEDLALARQPVLCGEFGVSAATPAEVSRLDPAGIGLHDALWSTALSGSFGVAMSWWWDSYVDGPPERYDEFGSIARFLDGVAWDHQGFVPTGAVASSPVRRLATFGLDGQGEILVWIKNLADRFTRPDPVPVTDAHLALSNPAPGRWTARWWDTHKGTPFGVVDVAAGTTSLSVPAFSGDVAIRLQPA